MNTDNLKISFLGHKKEVEQAKTCFAREFEEGRLFLFNLSSFFSGPRHKVHASYFSDVAIYDYVRNQGRRDYEGVWERGMRKRVLLMLKNKLARRVIVLFEQNYGHLAVFSLQDGDSEEIRRSIPCVRFFDAQGNEVRFGEALQARAWKTAKFTEVRDYRLLLENI